MSFDFVGFDVETANWARGSVCAIGLVVVRGGEIEKVENWLCQPPGEGSEVEFDPFNISIHGIHPHMVENEPPFKERLDQALALIGDLPVIAHNAAFDMGALREGCDRAFRDWPMLSYGCTVVMSRRVKQLISYRLPFVCEAFDVELENHHDAASDALAAAKILLAINREKGADNVAELAKMLEVQMGSIQGDFWRGCSRVFKSSGGRGNWDYGPLPTADLTADPGHPFYGQTVVFTGGLGMRREDAWAAVAALGGTPENTVTKRTNFLVVGDGFKGHEAAEFQTGKAQKAVKWLEKGHHIEVLNEEDFMQLLADRSAGGRFDQS